MSRILVYYSGEASSTHQGFFANTKVNTVFSDSIPGAVERLDSQIFDAFVVFIKDDKAERELISACRDRHPSMPIILLVGQDSQMSALDAKELGVTEYLRFPCDHDAVLLHVEKAIEASRIRAEHSYLLDQALEGEREISIAGDSGAMERVRNLISKVAKSRSNVLLAGESGTGKELVAQAIHQATTMRTRQPLIKVNCPGIPAQLFESELFGHVKGSFTGAHESRKGKFELAGEGNILLDEVSELSLELQAKLLRVLESRRFTRVGGSVEIEVKARVIAATNRDLTRMVNEGGFREDLFYRLNVFPISLPTLRTRKEDIRETALHLLCHIGSSCGLVAEGISKEAMKALESYHWPGNVRELRNILERALVLAGGGIVDNEYLPWEIQDTSTESPETDGRFNAKVEAYKKRLLLEALKKNAWVKKEASRELGLTQRALSHYVNRFELDKHRLSGNSPQ